jgi:dipeptidyl aminopeptidase/acylaminoacyl peptidase
MKRFLRLGIIAFILVIIISVTINFGLAWMMVTAMTHPFCIIPNEMAGLHPQEYWLETEDGISIRVWYYPSKNGAGVISFGGMSGALGNRLPPAEALIQAGFGVVQIDSRACAQPSTPVTQGYDELSDGRAALEFLRSRTEIDPDRIGAMGFSMGGAAALRMAANQPEIQGVVRDGGFSNLGELLSPDETRPLTEKIFQNTILFFYKFRSGIDPWEMDSIADLERINPRPILLIYGEHESPAGEEQFASSSGNVSLWIVPSGRHGRNHIVAPQEYHERVLNFFDQALNEK